VRFLSKILDFCGEMDSRSIWKDFCGEMDSRSIWKDFFVGNQCLLIIEAQVMSKFGSCVCAKADMSRSLLISTHGFTSSILEGIRKLRIHGLIYTRRFPI
jgi:hypothetical protein